MKKSGTKKKNIQRLDFKIHMKFMFFVEHP